MSSQGKEKESEREEIKPLVEILKKNICWTCTKKDIINKQIPELVDIWIQQYLNEYDEVYADCPNLITKGRIATIQQLKDGLK
jgi:hypothetical protein